LLLNISGCISPYTYFSFGWLAAHLPHIGGDGIVPVLGFKSTCKLAFKKRKTMDISRMLDHAVSGASGKAGGLKDLNRSKRLDELRRS
jgi:hypothetical protein